MKVKLTKRFAEFIDGVNLSRAKPGDVLDLPPREAGILLAEEWALPVDGELSKIVQTPRPNEGTELPTVRAASDPPDRLI